MKPTTLLLILLFLACVATYTLRCYGEECGTERWSVKTLQDADEKYVDFTNIKDVSVEWLTQWPRQAYYPGNGRVDPIETTLFRVHALLKGYKHEKDSDFHVVIADLNKPKITMIAEVPASRCANPTYAKAFDTVRKFLLSQVGRPRGTGKMLWLPAPVPVVITGVGFFDKCHGQTGRAPNCIELHPIINFESDFHGGEIAK